MLHTAFKLFVALDSTSTDAAAGCEKLVCTTHGSKAAPLDAEVER